MGISPVAKRLGLKPGMYPRRFGGPELLIVIGSCAFMSVLGLSALFEADIRWLHFFQAWMYLAAIALSLRHNRWGYFIGISAAGLWNYMSLFVNTFFHSGLYWLATSVATARIQRVDQILAVPAWIGNFLVIVGCIWAYGRMSEKKARDTAWLALTFILTTAFFAADVWVFQPRYLPQFRQILHPHSPLR